jgi:hypothetical protein
LGKPLAAAALLHSLTRWVGLTSRRGRAYSDQKVANREIRVWHFVIENGY